MNPVVSVIVAFLNMERFLAETVESVLAQDYQDWELLLVDDGSTDGSTKMAQDYAARWPERIRYCEHPGHQNQGLSASRNFGALHSRGELLAFLDADDVWLPTMLQKQVATLQAHPEAAMLAEATCYWRSWLPDSPPDTLVAVGVPGGRTYAPPELLARLYPLGTGAAPCTCGLLVRRTAFLAVGGCEESFRQLYEDQAFLTKIYLQYSVYISDEWHNLYRQRPGSIMHTTQAQYDQVRGAYLHWYRRYLRQHGWAGSLPDRLVSRALRAQRWRRVQAWGGRAVGLLRRIAKRLLGRA